MPFRVPRQPTQQAAYNRQLQESYAATRRVPPSSVGMEAGSVAGPAAPARDPLADLKELAELHKSGVLTDAEFTAAKANLLGTDAR